MSNIALVVMARYPETGKTKTRLGRIIGDDRAVSLYQAFLTDLAQRFAGQAYDLHWAYTPPEANFPAFIATLAPYYAPYMTCFPQQGADLGARLHHVFTETHKRGFERTVVIGSDIPHISLPIVARAIKALDEADICLLMLDAGKGITAQDLAIFALAVKKGKGIVVLVNKWDLVEDKKTNTTKDYEKELKKRFAPFSDVPIIFISVTEKQRIFKSIEAALEVFENRHRKIPTSKLNDVMLKAVEGYHPPVVRGNQVKIKYITQLPTNTPTFAFFCNYPDDIKTPYKNYLENQLREKFKFSGVPVRLFFRKK